VRPATSTFLKPQFDNSSLKSFAPDDRLDDVLDPAVNGQHPSRALDECNRVDPLEAADLEHRAVPKREAPGVFELMARPRVVRAEDIHTVAASLLAMLRRETAGIVIG
jgi:hypothetical protein